MRINALDQTPNAKWHEPIVNTVVEPIGNLGNLTSLTSAPFPRAAQYLEREANPFRFLRPIHRNTSLGDLSRTRHAAHAAAVMVPHSEFRLLSSSPSTGSLL